MKECKPLQTGLQATAKEGKTCFAQEDDTDKLSIAYTANYGELPDNFHPMFFAKLALMPLKPRWRRIGDNDVGAVAKRIRAALRANA